MSERRRRWRPPYHRGPLMDANGQVVGINTAAASTAESIGFAIAIGQAEPILEPLAS